MNYFVKIEAKRKSGYPDWAIWEWDMDNDYVRIVAAAKGGNDRAHYTWRSLHSNHVMFCTSVFRYNVMTYDDVVLDLI